MKFTFIAAGLVAAGLVSLPFLAASDPIPVDTCAEVGGPKEQVSCYIANNPVMVFSKSYCGFSMKAKSTLGAMLKGSDLRVLELDQHPHMREMQAELHKITGGKTVPRVFVAGEFIGGGDETKAMAASGELQKKLTAAGVSFK